MTKKSTRSITRRGMSARVMYRLPTVLYHRLFGYFLIVRGSLMDGSLTMGCAPSVVPGVCYIPYYIDTSNPTRKARKRKTSAAPRGGSSHLPHALEPVQTPMSAGPLE